MPKGVICTCTSFYHECKASPAIFVSCQMVVLIPKEKGDYCGIGLVEVVWKVEAVIINFWLTDSITYHDLFHEFRAGHGTGTATLEAKVLQKLAAMR